MVEKESWTIIGVIFAVLTVAVIVFAMTTGDPT